MLREAVITLRLGALVVHFTADNEASDAQTRLENSIKHHSTFSMVEKTRLHAYLLRRLNALENMQAVRAEVAHLALSKRRRVRSILLTLLFADNDINSTKRHYSEKLYLALGLTQDVLEDDINTFRTYNVTQQNTLQLQAFDTNIEKNSVSAVFSKDNNIPTRQAASVSESVTASFGQKSLSEKREQLYKKLVLKEKWSHTGFNQLCKQHKLAPEGALDILNQWAYQQVNASVVKYTTDAIVLKMDIVAKLQQITHIA